MLLLVLILVLAAFGLLLVGWLTSSVIVAWTSVAVSVAAAVVLVIDNIQRRAALRAGDERSDDIAPGTPRRGEPAVDPHGGVRPGGGPGGTGGFGGPFGGAGGGLGEVEAATEVLPVIRPGGPAPAGPGGMPGGPQQRPGWPGDRSAPPHGAPPGPGASSPGFAPAPPTDGPVDNRQTVVMPAVQPSGQPSGSADAPLGAGHGMTPSSDSRSRTVTESASEPAPRGTAEQDGSNVSPLLRKGTGSPSAASSPSAPTGSTAGAPPPSRDLTPEDIDGPTRITAIPTATSSREQSDPSGPAAADTAVRDTVVRDTSARNTSTPEQGAPADPASAGSAPGVPGSSGPGSPEPVSPGAGATGVGALGASPDVARGGPPDAGSSNAVPASATGVLAARAVDVGGPASSSSAPSGSASSDPGGGVGHDVPGSAVAGDPAAADDLTGEPPEEPHVPTAALVVSRLEDDVIVVDEQPRYHLPDCRALRGVEPIPLPAREAVELGFSPCGWCTPDRVLAERHSTTVR